MKQVLRISPTSIPVTTLQVEKENPPPLDKVKEALSARFAQLFQTTMELKELSIEEKALIYQLIQTRYINDNWTYMR